MFGLIILRAIGLWCVMHVIQNHTGMTNTEGCLLGFGVMMMLGTLFDKGKL